MLDVDDIIGDPDFYVAFQVIRVPQTIDAHGRANAPDTSAPGQTVYGCVQPASGRALEMLPDMTHVSGMIEVWTRFRLEGPSDATRPDVIKYGGRSYIVRAVQPWTGWGRGFVHAVCELYDLLGPTPTTPRRVTDRGDG